MYVGNDTEGQMWRNFLDYCGADWPKTVVDNKLLEEFNAVDDKQSLFVRFETEEDAIAFKLKFG